MSNFNVEFTLLACPVILFFIALITQNLDFNIIGWSILIPYWISKAVAKKFPLFLKGET